MIRKAALHRFPFEARGTIATRRSRSVEKKKEKFSNRVMGDRIGLNQERSNHAEHR